MPNQKRSEKQDKSVDAVKTPPSEKPTPRPAPAAKKGAQAEVGGPTPQAEPVVKADVRPENVPDNLAGTLPENRGQDPGDVNRDRKEAIADFVNRLITTEQAAVDVVLRIAKAEEGDARERLEAMAEEDLRAIDALETAVRDLGESTHAARRTAGTLAASARFLMSSVPRRAKQMTREVTKSRDFSAALDAARRRSPAERVVDYMDAAALEAEASVRWRVLRRVADATNERALVDAVSAHADAVASHESWLRAEAERVAVSALSGGPGR